MVIRKTLFCVTAYLIEQMVEEIEKLKVDKKDPDK
jgi:hypothetical protein